MDELSRTNLLMGRTVEGKDRNDDWQGCCADAVSFSLSSWIFWSNSNEKTACDTNSESCWILDPVKDGQSDCNRNPFSNKGPVGILLSFSSNRWMAIFIFFRKSSSHCLSYSSTDFSIFRFSLSFSFSFSCLRSFVWARAAWTLYTSILLICLTLGVAEWHANEVRRMKRT